MKVATLSGISDVKCRMTLEPGFRVGIKHTGSVGTKNFTLQSVARDKNDMVYVFVTEPMSNTIRQTLMLKLGTKDPAMLIGGTVEPVTVSSITYKGEECTPDGNGKLSYEGTKRQNVERPVVVGDLFRSSRREYIVEYIAKDGSLVCRMYSVQSKEFVGMVIIDGSDSRVLESLHVKIKFAYS